MHVQVNDGDYIVQRDPGANASATDPTFERERRPKFVVFRHGSSNPTARFTNRIRAEDFAREKAAQTGKVGLFLKEEGGVELL